MFNGKKATYIKGSGKGRGKKPTPESLENVMVNEIDGHLFEEEEEGGKKTNPLHESMRFGPVVRLEEEEEEEEEGGMIIDIPDSTQTPVNTPESTNDVFENVSSKKRKGNNNNNAVEQMNKYVSIMDIESKEQKEKINDLKKEIFVLKTKTNNLSKSLEDKYLEQRKINEVLKEANADLEKKSIEDKKKIEEFKQENKALIKSNANLKKYEQWVSMVRDLDSNRLF